MILLLDGATHTGKTYIAQKLMEKIRVPYLSLDHLKMGLIRSGCIQCTVNEDDRIKNEMWPIVEGIVKTGIENKQSLIVEGAYIPKNYKLYFSEEYLEQIYSVCLILSPEYIRNNYEKIIAYENAIEHRLHSEDIYDLLLEDNRRNLEECKRNGIPFILVDTYYDVDKMVSAILEIIGR